MWGYTHLVVNDCFKLSLLNDCSFWWGVAAEWMVLLEMVGAFPHGVVMVSWAEIWVVTLSSKWNGGSNGWGKMNLVCTEGDKVVWIRDLKRLSTMSFIMVRLTPEMTSSHPAKIHSSHQCMVQMGCVMSMRKSGQTIIHWGASPVTSKVSFTRNDREVGVLIV